VDDLSKMQVEKYEKSHLSMLQKRIYLYESSMWWLHVKVWMVS